MIKTHTHKHTHTRTCTRSTSWNVILILTWLQQSWMHLTKAETSLWHVICFFWNLIHWSRKYWGLFVSCINNIFPVHDEAYVLFTVLSDTWRMWYMSECVLHMCKNGYVDLHKFCSCLEAAKAHQRLIDVSRQQNLGWRAAWGEYVQECECSSFVVLQT